MSYGDALRGALIEEQREQQERRASHHVLGMSALGGCREFMRASIEGDEGITPGEADLKWAAMVGTLLGDRIEDVATRRLGAVTQSRLSLRLLIDGVEVIVEGSADLIFPEGVDDEPPAVVDLKTVSELATVRREGPKFGYRAQIAGYLIAAVSVGILSPDAVGELVFFDRSGKDSDPHAWRVDMDQAEAIMEAVESRLLDVVHAINTGQRAPRDEDPSWCAAVGCPFFNGCWGDGSTLEVIVGESTVDAMRRYKEARDMVKQWTASRDTARDDLKGSSGIFEDGTRLSWTEMANGALRIDVWSPK